MEIEAKIRVADVETLHRLQETQELAGFILSAGKVKQVRDTYLDTADRRILAGGYACRRREQGDEILFTLKSLTPAESAIHRREEVETSVPEDVPPARWPDGPARDLALDLIGDAMLEPLFEVNQTRTVRLLSDHDRPVAELSLDEVQLVSGDRQEAFYELEAELTPQGTEEDLVALVSALRDEWGLKPETRSKFERGLALAGTIPDPWPLETLLDHYQVDRTHARIVADHALRLFDALLPVHGLPLERRALLETAALVHNIGMEADPARHHTVGRDILLAHPPAGLDDTERRIVAAITFLHRKAITEKKLNKAFSALLAGEPATVRSETAALAALVRMADGLDYSQTASTQLGQVTRQDGTIEFEITGPEATLDAERAQSKSDLWQLLFEIDLRFTAPEPPVLVEVLPPVEIPEPMAEPAAPYVPEGPGVEADDPMDEAARKILQFHLQRMLDHEPGTRSGEDPEELHDMRVATRRMRAALGVFDGYLDPKQVRPVAEGLRRTGRRLGEVRDLDVLRQTIQAYLDTLPPDGQSALDPLLAAWQAQREAAREQLLSHLDSKRYTRFKAEFEDFLRSPRPAAVPQRRDPGDVQPFRVRHVAPVSVYEHLAVVRAAGERATGSGVPLENYHRLRIACKGLRYTFEFFAEVLGREAKTLIDEMKGVQDHLGELQDAVVACNVLRDFLTWGTWDRPKSKEAAWPAEPIIAPGVAAYLSARQAELQRLVASFPALWARIENPAFSLTVAAAVGVL